jgi:hypothetical protein
MDDPTLNRAVKNPGMPVSSLVLAAAFHVSILFALLWSPPTTSTPLIPEDAIDVTIERRTTSLAALSPSMAIPEPPVDRPPIEPAPPVPPQPVPQVEPAQTPTLENAVPEPEPPPEPTLRDFPKVEPAVRKPAEKKPSPKSDAKPDLSKDLKPPSARASPNASTAAPLPKPADVVQPDKEKNERLARMWGTKYLDRMGIRPSHLATLTATSGGSCYQDPEPYKLEITNDKLTVTNQYGIMFSITVPADGEIYHHYKRPPMAGDIIEKVKGNWMIYTMKGNVKSGRLEIWHYNCVYKLNLY